MLQRVLTGVALLLAAAPATAHAAQAPRWGLTPTGDPLLSPPVSGADSMQWWVCPPAAACGAYTAPGTDSPVFRNNVQHAPGEVARGTYFEGEGLASGTAETITERSPMWLGRVTARNHPRISGSRRVGQQVAPVGALWSGGWADDVSTLTVVACPVSTRVTCEYLTQQNGAVAGPGPRKLQRKHRGWHVYAVDQRTAADDPAPDLEPGPAPRPVASALVAVSERRGPVRSAK